MAAPRQILYTIGFLPAYCSNQQSCEIATLFKNSFSASFSHDFSCYFSIKTLRRTTSKLLLTLQDPAPFGHLCLLPGWLLWHSLVSAPVTLGTRHNYCTLQCRRQSCPRCLSTQRTGTTHGIVPGTWPRHWVWCVMDAYDYSVQPFHITETVKKNYPSCSTLSW